MLQKQTQKLGKQSEITLSWQPLGSALLAQRFHAKKFFIYIYIFGQKI